METTENISELRRLLSIYEKDPKGLSSDWVNFFDDLDEDAILLKGMTVEYLFNRVYKIKKGEFFLFHAAAGGVGLVACQWARAVGARMIGTVGNKEKMK